ncbi:dynamin-related protein 3B-like [Macadamia integrifolia]|uniref:dynamin-related protein 3B-like n=1 Tax=Macadamia integrifolia TaxID=60698 RepID=UPI001C4FF1AE|nr:dynamin-related protein 3B-like [Macadamia integrifolia]
MELVTLSETERRKLPWLRRRSVSSTNVTDSARRRTEAETEREAGGNKGLSDKQIRLKIYSPNVLDITLVDLPGITKVPVGDQPYDIEARIRTMILSYIKHPSCLILAVTPANSDLANSDALQIAGTADPDGYRTIGVISKLDIMDRGTDARNFLLGKVIPLRLGYVGVVNRSQEDINQNRSIKDALVYEDNFFRSRPVYNGLADRCGIPQLAKKLNQILVQHIKTVLPGLKSRISSALVAVAKEHASYGEITESKAGQGALLLNILTKYSEGAAPSSLVYGVEAMLPIEIQGRINMGSLDETFRKRTLKIDNEEPHEHPQDWMHNVTSWFAATGTLVLGYGTPCVQVWNSRNMSLYRGVQSLLTLPSYGKVVLPLTEVILL